MMMSRKDALVAMGLMAVSLPKVAFAKAEGNLTESVSRIYYEQVLDTYDYFICYEDHKYDRPLCNPRYKNLSFKTSYTRVYPDELYNTCLSCPDPGGSGVWGVLKSYKCKYKTW